MEGLRPERDELDQYKSQKKKGSDSLDMPKPKTVTASAKKDGGGSALMMLLVALLVVACSALVWVYLKQQEQLVVLQKEIEVASGFIGQSKLVLARFEGQLSETGAELEQTGSVAEQKLAFLDSEVKKLWGVANDRNKKLIQANSDSIVAVEKKIAQWELNQKKTIEKIAAEQLGLQESISQISASVTGLGSRVSTLASELVINRAEQDEQLDALKSGLKGVKTLNDTLGNHEKSIASIDSSRRQLNERVVALEQKLNSVQLQLNSLGKPPYVQ